MIVAIDGPAGSGKSTIARMVAEGLGFNYVNSGNIYRAMTLRVLRRHVDPGDARGGSRGEGGGAAEERLTWRHRQQVCCSPEDACRGLRENGGGGVVTLE